MLTAFTFLVLVVLFVLWKTFIIVHMREAVVVQRLGKFRVVLPPGFHFIIPFFDRVAYRHERVAQGGIMICAPAPFSAPIFTMASSQPRSAFSPDTNADNRMRSLALLRLSR